MNQRNTQMAQEFFESIFPEIELEVHEQSSFMYSIIKTKKKFIPRI